MISIVVPAFNEERPLPWCLESLKNQDYEGDYEIIVVDNASTDGTARVAQEFGATVEVCDRRGVVYARQAGAEAASGDIIVQADADTVYPPDWLSRIARHFSVHPNSVALTGAYHYQDPSPWWARIEYFARHTTNLLSWLYQTHPALVSGANFAFRREAFVNAGGYDENSFYPDQWGIAHRLAKTGEISYDSKLLVSTSPRRVQKPTPVICLEVARNLIGMIGHFAGYAAGVSTRRAKKSLLSRSPARTAISIILAGTVGFFSWGYFAPSSQVFGKVYYHQKTITDKIVAITFDDGPNEPYTSEILDILENYGINATFFVIGKNVELQSETAKRIVAEGNVIGNHSQSHNANHALTTYGYRDIELAQDTIVTVTGVSPHLYRPPHGKKSPWELYALKRLKLVEVTWSISANDQHIVGFLGKPSPEMLAQEIVSKVRPGGIVLLHDGYGTNHGDIKADKSLTVKTLPLIIEELQKQGYEFVTVPELLKLPAYN